MQCIPAVRRENVEKKESCHVCRHKSVEQGTDCRTDFIQSFNETFAFNYLSFLFVLRILRKRMENKREKNIIRNAQNQLRDNADVGPNIFKNVRRAPWHRDSFLARPKSEGRKKCSEYKYFANCYDGARELLETQIDDGKFIFRILNRTREKKM